MAGNARSGRKRTPTTKLKARGTFRADRHGARVDAKGAAPLKAGAPVPIDGLDPVGRALFDQLLPHLTRIAGATECDSFQIFALCQAWSFYRKSVTAAAVDPTEQKHRAAVIAYHRQFDSIAARFGLTPADRARLEAPLPQTADEDAEFLG